MNLFNTLQKKAVLIVSAIVFFIIGINTAVLTYVSYDKFRAAIHAKTEAVGSGFRGDLYNVLSLGVPLYAFDGLNAKLSELIERDRSIGYALIVDASGRVLFHHDAAQQGRILEDAITRKILSAKRDLIQPGKLHTDHAFALFDADETFVGALRIGVKSHAVNSQLYDLLSSSVIVSILCFLFATMLAHFSISRFISRPVQSMERAAKQIASGSLVSRVSIEGNDELASLGNAINSISSNLKGMIASVRSVVDKVNQVTADIRESSRLVISVCEVQKREIDETASSIDEMDSSIESIAEAAGNLSASSDETSSAIVQMRSSIQNVAQNSDMFSETAQETASSVEELTTSIKHIAASLDNLSTASSDIASSIAQVGATTNDIEQRAKESVELADAVLENARGKGLSAAAASTQGMTTIREGVEAISSNINSLGTKASAIGDIVSVIDDVAAKTNLLALNAAVLASRAGEHGRGFAVVATEIKELADKTTLSTRDIGALIQSVQNDMESSVSTVAEEMDVVNRGITLVEDVQHALNLIVESAEESAEKARAIQRATSEEAGVIKQIQTAVGSVSEQTEKISMTLQEQNRGSTFIVSAAEKVKDLSHQVKTATIEQRDGSQRIAEESTSITAQAKQIAEATRTQREKSEHIVQAIDRVHRTTTALRESSASLDEAITSLGTEAAVLAEELEKFELSTS